MDDNTLSKLKKWFSRYARTFLTGDTLADRNITLKIKHTARVRRHILNIADSLHLPAQARALAEAIALLHDVGRFRQFQIYRTFNDRLSEDHALMALEVITEENCLAGASGSDRDLIKKAVLNHNKLELPPDDEKALFFSRLIRDADKLDIFDLIIADYDKLPEERNPEIDFNLPATGGYSRQYIDDILHNRLCDNRHLHNANDVKLMRLSWLFDLNFSYSLAYAGEIGYIERIARHLPHTGAVEKIIAHLREYLAERRTGDQAAGGMVS